MDISIVIPTYNSARILPELVDRIDRAMSRIPCIREFEVILVNDCSPDTTWRVITDLCDASPNVRGIDLRKNAGQHNAIMAGLKRASGRFVVVMDDDLQHAPEDIARLLAKLEEGWDVCYAAFSVRKHAWWKVIGSRFNNFAAMYLLGKPPSIQIASFKAMTSEIRQELSRFDSPYVYIDGLIFMITERITNVGVEHHDRFEGTGNYGVGKSFYLWTKMATSFSITPLRVASGAGLLFAFLGAILALFIALAKVFGSSVAVPGWTSTVIVVLVMGGVQLLALGAIGEYVGRAYTHLNGKPQSVIRSTKGF